MLELALNKSKEKGSGVGNITLGQPTTNFDDLVATMAPPPSCMTMPTTYSNAFPTTMTSDIYTTKRGKQQFCCSSQKKIIRHIIHVNLGFHLLSSIR
jgi:hypothetical protein